MKKLFALTCLAAVMLSLQLSAAPVSLEQAKATAKQYLVKANAGKMMAPAASEPVLFKQVMGDINKSTPVLYIFNTSTNFVIVSGDDRAEEILAIGDSPLPTDKFPANVQAWLDMYKNELDWLIANPDAKVQKISSASPPKAVTGTYGPLLTALWDQEAPYWNQCKFTYSGTTYQCLTGCPATSASMVLYYWKWPKQAVPALPSYTAALELSYWNSVNFTYPALPSVTFDWDNMKDTYSNYTTAQGNAVATLMRYVGQAEHMMYGTSAAGGSGIYTTDTQNIVDMYVLFGYDETTCRVISQSSYSTANWANLLQTEMAEGRPVVYTAVASSGGGHAFNVDGYRSSDNKYHINFGWSGDGNNWCVMNSFSDGDGYTFNQGQQMVIGIQPKNMGPMIESSVADLNMTCNTGETATATFTVKGSNLTDKVNITKTDANNVFSVSPTSVTIAQAEAGQTVTVTFHPTAHGTFTGKLTLKSADAEDVIVNLNGVATLKKGNVTLQEATDVTETSFKAMWTDATPRANVASYTLEVKEYDPNAATLLIEENFNKFTAPNSTDIGTTLDSWMDNTGWTGSKLYREDGGIRLGTSSAKGTLTSPALDLSDSEGKVTVKFTAIRYNNDNNPELSISCGSSTQTLAMTDTDTEYTVVLDAPTQAGQKVEFATTKNGKRVIISHIEIHNGDVSEATMTLKAPAEQGDANYRLVTGITDLFYNITGLTPAKTYRFKVKPLYIDGTEGNWTKNKQVTLAGQAATLPGDVNNDGKVDVQDVNILVNILLGTDQASNYEGRADVDGNGKVDVGDINTVINTMLNSNN
ncbi:MAG: C10 family peptidase [Muribaculaceae bacterium]|nr:C10 family peptidase [Muribaculaceae bacterium]